MDIGRRESISQQLKTEKLFVSIMHMKNYINQNAISFASHEKIEELSQKSKGSPLKELTGLA